ncbi:hypothetical protein Trydic_g7638 [Trypoxylus dichotomus]
MYSQPRKVLLLELGALTVNNLRIWTILTKRTSVKHKMSIYFSGTFKRSAGVISAITKELKSVNLKSVKKIQVQFDPFHENAVTARDFLHFITSAKVTSTNTNCKIRTSVVCDRSEPEIKVDLIDSGTVKFLANNLTVLEIFQQFNKHISSQVKPEEPTVAVIPTKTKLQKKLKK